MINLFKSVKPSFNRSPTMFAVWRRPSLISQPVMRFAVDEKVDLSNLAPTNSVLKLYENLVNDEKIRSDPHQLAIISKLDRWQAGFLAQEPRI